MSLNSSRKLSAEPLSIDTRTAADIEQNIARLAESYETGWHPDPENPDIGGAIAKVFSNAMEENIGRVNDILERYHTEFVNMLDISLLPAKPSEGILVLDLVADTIEGCGVPKGTKFLSSGEDPVVFETDHSLYVTSSRLSTAFLTDGEEHAFIPLLGDFTVPELCELHMTEEGTSIVTEGRRVESYPHLEPFRLFGRSDGIGSDAVLFYHPYVFDVDGEEIFVRFEEDGDLVSDIAAGKYTFYWLSERGLAPVESCRIAADKKTLILKKSGVPAKVTVAHRAQDMLALCANGPASETKEVRSVTFSARGEGVHPECVTGMGVDLPCDRFVPFSDTISLYGECTVGMDRYFSKAGATVTLSFVLSFEENRITLTKEEQEENLKIIKRRPSDARTEAFTDSFVDEVVFTYFNGTGWRRLPFDASVTALFDTTKTGRIELSFVCPDDWEADSTGAYSGRSLRMQITKADNCYLRPAVHHYPVLSDVRISYTYEDTFLPASRIVTQCGLAMEDLTLKAAAGKELVMFSPSDYKEDALYLGFTQRIASGPASILFELSDEVRYNGLDLVFEYSAGGAFRQLKVLDYTKGFTHSGVVAFVPPADWERQTLSGMPGYYIRLVRLRKGSDAEDKGTLPLVRAIYLNAVSVSNVETLPVQEVYIEEVVPGMRFSLGATGVLDADVWVNEMGRFSQEKMSVMAEAMPDEIRAERDSLGQITAFYVKWTETERFEASEDKRVYQIDRLTNELIFGDGIHTWIPRVVDDVAVRFSVRCCDGAAGNVAANTITEAEQYLMYVGSVTNPVKSYGGSNIESIENALKRGASSLSSRGRLVTLGDYEREILAYSDSIAAASGIMGETVEGEQDDAAITFVLLMKEFEEGSYAFHRIVGGLKEHLLSRCELTVAPEKLHIIEPVYVSVSVSVWVSVVDLDDSFEIQNALSDCLREYLSPLREGIDRSSRIGTIPKKPQILMRLGVLKSRAIVRRSVMIATYTDAQGYHEVDLGDLKVTSFMVVRSGEHKVHIV